MILLARYYRLLSFLIIRCQESGENLALFCYLILWARARRCGHLRLSVS